MQIGNNNPNRNQHRIVECDDGSFRSKVNVSHPRRARRVKPKLNFRHMGEIADDFNYDDPFEPSDKHQQAVPKGAIFFNDEFADDDQPLFLDDGDLGDNTQHNEPTNQPKEEDEMQINNYAPRVKITPANHKSIKGVVSERAKTNPAVEAIDNDSYEAMQKLGEAFTRFNDIMLGREKGDGQDLIKEFVLDKEAIDRFTKRIDENIATFSAAERARKRAGTGTLVRAWGPSDANHAIQGSNVMLAVTAQEELGCDVESDHAIEPSYRGVQNFGGNSIRIKYKSSGELSYGDTVVNPGKSFNTPLLQAGHDSEAAFRIASFAERNDVCYAERFTLVGEKEIEAFLTKAEGYGINIAEAKRAVVRAEKNKTTSATQVKTFKITVMQSFDESEFNTVCPFSWVVESVQLKGVSSSEHETTGERRYIKALHPVGGSSFRVYSIALTNPVEINSIPAEVPHNRIIIQESDWSVDEFGNCTENPHPEEIVIENPKFSELNKELIKRNLNITPTPHAEKEIKLVEMVESEKEEKRKVKAEMKALKKAKKEQKRAFKAEIKAMKKGMKSELKREIKDGKRFAKSLEKRALNSERKLGDAKAKFRELKIETKRKDAAAERAYNKLDQKLYKAEVTADVTHSEVARRGLETRIKMADSGVRYQDSQYKNKGANLKLIATGIGITALVLGLMTSNASLVKVGTSVV